MPPTFPRSIEPSVFFSNEASLLRFYLLDYLQPTQMHFILHPIHSLTPHRASQFSVMHACPIFFCTVSRFMLPFSPFRISSPLQPTLLTSSSTFHRRTYHTVSTHHTVHITHAICIKPSNQMYSHYLSYSMTLAIHPGHTAYILALLNIYHLHIISCRILDAQPRTQIQMCGTGTRQRIAQLIYDAFCSSCTINTHIMRLLNEMNGGWTEEPGLYVEAVPECSVDFCIILWADSWIGDCSWDRPAWAL
jgi:hypothetical protein